MTEEEPFDPSNLTALVLDENHYARRITLDILRSMGFRRVSGAKDTAEAWETLTKTNPDIVLVEWIHGSTLEFVRRIRMSEDAPNRAVPVFMLTSRGSATDVEVARKAGVDGYLVKPISALALQQRVRFVIAKPQPFIVTASYVGPCRRRRQDPAYSGPMRRLDDVAPAANVLDDEESDLRAELARARVAALEASGRDLIPGDAKAARRVYRATQDLLEVAEKIDDANLAFGAREMVRYLQAQGATALLDPEVVRTHIAALHQLAHLPHVLSQERARVAAGLKKMVDKKLKQMNAA
jgi:DNA-binding response OmpR family regulator